MTMNPELELAIADARAERAGRHNAKKCEKCSRLLGHEGAHVTFCYKKTIAWLD